VKPPLPTAGVLALQGSSAPHLERLTELFAAGELAAPPREVRQRRDLEGLSHVVLPGGESTTIRHLLDLFGLTDELVARWAAGTLRLFGTCAGAILLGQDDGTRPKRLALLDATLTRNAYGRQIDSFSEEIELALPVPQHAFAGAPAPAASNRVAPAVDRAPFHGVFIRAPRFTRVGDGVRVLARHRGETVLIAAPGLLAGTFHPELTRDLRIHRWFLGMPAAAPGTTPPDPRRHPSDAAAA
jgi:5'-phosphate synthase pdxT subunit